MINSINIMKKRKFFKILLLPAKVMPITLDPNLRKILIRH